MKCPKCNSKLKRIKVSIEGAKGSVLSSQCIKCEYFRFDKKDASKALEELKEQPLKIKQKIIKLSSNRLGLYFNKHIISSLGLEQGKEIYVSVPDKKHILLYLE